MLTVEVCVFTVCLWNAVSFGVRLVDLEAIADGAKRPGIVVLSMGLALNAVTVITLFVAWHKMKYGW